MRGAHTSTESCSFMMDSVHEQNGVRFDLDQNKYVVFVAAGKVNDGEDASFRLCLEMFNYDPNVR